MKMDFVFDKVVTVVVGRAVADPRLDPSASHPHRKAAGVMIPAKVLPVEFTLTIVGPTKLSAPNHKRVFQQSTIGGSAAGVPGLTCSLGAS